MENEIVELMKKPVVDKCVLAVSREVRDWLMEYKRNNKCRSVDAALRMYVGLPPV